MKPLNCPKCNGHLEAVIYSGVEIDRCQNCNGMWFDHLEAETLKKISGSETVDIGNAKIAACLFNQVKGDIKCPRCRESMIQMLDMDRYSIWYEKCFECEGVWLDAGEFKQFKRNFATKNLFSFVKKVLKIG